MAPGDSGKSMENRYLSNGKNGNPWLFSVYIGNEKTTQVWGLFQKPL